MLLLVALFAQQAAPSGDWVSYLVTATGPAGVVAGVIWKVHTDHVKRSQDREAALRDENREMRTRLFTLAERGMAVGQTASEVAANEARDPELVRLMEDVRASLRERNG